MNGSLYSRNLVLLNAFFYLLTVILKGRYCKFFQELIFSLRTALFMIPESVIQARIRNMRNEGLHSRLDIASPLLRPLSALRCV